MTLYIYSSTEIIVWSFFWIIVEFYWWIQNSIDSVGINVAHAQFQVDIEDTKLDLGVLNSLAARNFLYRLFLAEPTIRTSQS
jgi:hypothetical protein